MSEAGVGAPGRTSVVIVDDNENFRHLLRMILSRGERFRVVGEAEDGRQAVERAAALRPDIVLLDLNMPVMGGMEALPLILDASPGSRVVIVSGLDARDAEEQARAAGAVGYIEKGAGPREFQQALLDLADPEH